MTMTFICPACKHVHTGPKDSYLISPQGTFLLLPWYTDEKGLNHNAMTCLKCGSVHAVVPPSFLASLFSLGKTSWQVVATISPKYLQLMIDKHDVNVLSMMRIKPVILWVLHEKGLISLTETIRSTIEEESKETIRAFHIMNEENYDT